MTEENKPVETDQKAQGREELKRTVKFVLFSISAGVIELGVFTVLYELLHWSYWVAYLIALVLSVALSFIPTLLQEADTIRKAQIARGARFESRNLIEKARSFLPLILPIFLCAFRRADELSLAMEARGYRGAANRTKKAKIPLKKSDLLALGICSCICAVQFFL